LSACLVDTHAVLWFVTGSPRLSAAAQAVLHQENSTLYVSAASFWEIAIKAGSGRLEAGDDLPSAIAGEGFEPLDVTAEHAWRVRQLPQGDHRDPFDRLLVAQALVESLPIISNDRDLDQYGVARLW